MLKDVHFPGKVSGQKLDDYLAIGWYRIGQIIFTTDHIPHPEGWWRVFWLRFALNKLQFGQKQTKLIKANQRFDVTVKSLQLTNELEDLYNDYYLHIDFAASPSLHNNLFDYSVFKDSDHRVFDSQVIEIRDQKKLVAAGVFDKGEKSIAGIINFYHPSYRKYSMGKWLMLLKIKYAIENEMQFYYPGYIACDYNKFDYKLYPGMEAAELYDPVGKTWIPYSTSLMSELKNNLPEPE